MIPAQREQASEAEDAAIQAAVEVEKASGDKLFVRLRPNVRHLPGLRQRLEQEAKESGRLFVVEPGEPPAAQMLRARDERLAGTPVIDRRDTRKFLENLAAVAAGKVRVK